MFICTFYHTPVAFCDRGIVFLYYEGGVADATPPFFFCRPAVPAEGDALFHAGVPVRVNMSFSAERGKLLPPEN